MSMRIRLVVVACLLALSIACLGMGIVVQQLPPVFRDLTPNSDEARYAIRVQPARLGFDVALLFSPPGMTEYFPEVELMISSVPMALALGITALVVLGMFYRRPTQSS